MTSTLPPTYTHPAPLTTLAPHLLPHLPFSLPLLRRLQSHHTSSPSARTIATFPPSTTTTTAAAAAVAPRTPFAATWADRTRAPETECWIFSTYETLPARPPPTPAQRQEAKAQCLALLAGAARLPAATPTPLMVVGSLNEVLLRLVGGDEAAALVPQSVVSRDPMKKEEEGERGDGGGGGGATGRKGAGAVISGISVPYCKWLIGPPGRRRGAGGGKEGREREDEEEGSLPPGYAFSTPRRDELALTISRTEIPKTEDTLARLGSVGVRYTPVPPTSASASPSTSTSTSTCTTTNPTPTPTAPPDPPQQQSDLIAWAFLGPDGSLTSLHVEPAHRGRGLAKAVSRRLFRRLADDAEAVGFRPVAVAVAVDDDDNGDGDDDGDDDGVTGGGWAHSDVAVENAGSAGVARGLGGEEGWRVRWVGVDLGAVVGG